MLLEPETTRERLAPRFFGVKKALRTAIHAHRGLEGCSHDVGADRRCRRAGRATAGLAERHCSRMLSVRVRVRHGMLGSSPEGGLKEEEGGREFPAISSSGRWNISPPYT